MLIAKSTKMKKSKNQYFLILPIINIPALSSQNKLVAPLLRVRLTSQACRPLLKPPLARAPSVLCIEFSSQHVCHLFSQKKGGGGALPRMDALHFVGTGFVSQFRFLV